MFQFKEYSVYPLGDREPLKLGVSLLEIFVAVQADHRNQWGACSLVRLIHAGLEMLIA